MLKRYPQRKIRSTNSQQEFIRSQNSTEKRNHRVFYIPVIKDKHGQEYITLWIDYKDNFIKNTFFSPYFHSSKCVTFTFNPLTPVDWRSLNVLFRNMCISRLCVNAVSTMLKRIIGPRITESLSLFIKRYQRPGNITTGSEARVTPRLYFGFRIQIRFIFATHPNLSRGFQNFSSPLVPPLFPDSFKAVESRPERSVQKKPWTWTQANEHHREITVRACITLALLSLVEFCVQDAGVAETDGLCERSRPPPGADRYFAIPQRSIVKWSWWRED